MKKDLTLEELERRRAEIDAPLPKRPRRRIWPHSRRPTRRTRRTTDTPLPVRCGIVNETQWSAESAATAKLRKYFKSLTRSY